VNMNYVYTCDEPTYTNQLFPTNIEKTSRANKTYYY
jgi:hypothetical protein